MTNGFQPRKPVAVALTLKYKDAQEHLLRRLGQAVVLHWDELPDDLQDLLIDQAAAVTDRDEAPHGSDEIMGFIRSVKTSKL
jgi:hypothetical protein